MIDTLRLNLIDCEIKRSCPLSVQRGIIDYSTGTIYNENDLFIDNAGKIIKGSKAYLNDDKFNLTIQPTITSELNDYNHSKLKIKHFKRISETIQPDLFDYNSEDDEVKGIFISTSLPRLLSETNLKTLSYDEQQAALKILENRLKKFGIKTNINNALLSRVDTFTNISTEHIFYTYSNLLSLMECSRMKSVGYGNESFLWKNGNQELMIYDKVKEMRDKKPDIKIRFDKNIMRFENRLLKRRKILSSIKFETVGELYKNYDGLKQFHKREIEKKIFKYSIEDIDYKTTNNVESLMRFCRNQFGKHWFESFFKMKGMEQIIKIMDVDKLLLLVDEFDSDKKPVALRVKKSRIRKMFNDFKFYIGLFDSQLNSGLLKSNAELYEEIKTKFFKEVA
jgi:hypothetical protein